MTCYISFLHILIDSSRSSFDIGIQWRATKSDFFFVFSFILFVGGVTLLHFTPKTWHIMFWSALSLVMRCWTASLDVFNRSIFLYFETILSASRVRDCAFGFECFSVIKETPKTASIIYYPPFLSSCGDEHHLKKHPFLAFCPEVYPFSTSYNIIGFFLFMVFEFLCLSLSLDILPSNKICELSFISALISKMAFAILVSILSAVILWCTVSGGIFGRNFSVTVG